MKYHFKNERELDAVLGIDTSLTDMDWSVRGVHPCQPTPLAALEAVAERLESGQTVADLGCGTGRAVFALAAVGFPTIGIELDERRYAQAAENLTRCAKRAPEVARRIRLIRGAAQDFVPDGVDVFYCFNPFPAKVLRGVLRRIGDRPARMFCYYPDDEWVSLLTEEGWTMMESIDLRDALGRDERERIDVFGRGSN